MGGLLLLISIGAVFYVMLWSLKRDTLPSSHTDTSFLAIKQDPKLTTLKKTQRKRYGESANSDANEDDTPS